MEELQKAAKVAFASSFAFYLKAHNFHWNVEGSDFKQYHDLFGDIYEEVFESIDVFAEQIRAMDSYVPGSFTRFSMLSLIEDEDAVLTKEDMLVELIEDNEKLIKILKMVFKTSEEAIEPGFNDFIAGRIDAHKKHGWMLKASAKGSI
jgi:starvation-inducible DNA-binding protein